MSPRRAMVRTWVAPLAADPAEVVQRHSIVRLVRRTLFRHAATCYGAHATTPEPNWSTMLWT